MLEKAYHILFTAPLFAIMFRYCQSQGYHHHVCAGWAVGVQFRTDPGVGIVFEEVYYGSGSDAPGCGSTPSGRRSCGYVTVDDVLNYYCFGKSTCTVPISNRVFGSTCRDRSRHLVWKPPVHVREGSTQRLCDTRDMVATSSRGYVFGFTHQGHDCKISFGQSTSDTVQLFFISYYLINTRLARCGNNLEITSIGAQEISGAPCSTLHIFLPQHAYNVSLTGRITLIVRQHVLDVGFGFLLKYRVTPATTVTETPVLPRPVESTEPSFYTVSPGPLDNNGTTLTLPNPGISRFVKRDDIQPTAITEKDHRTIIIAVCMMILVAIVTTVVVVLLVVKRLRKNVKHDGEVQHAVQSLAYRPSLERNRYGDLPAATPDVIRRTQPNTPVPTYTSLLHTSTETPTQVQSSSPTPVQSNSPTQTDTSPSTPRSAPGLVLFSENDLYTGNEVLPWADTPIHGLASGADPSPGHGPPLVPPRATTEQLTTPQASSYVNENFDSGPTVDRSTRPDLQSVSPVHVPDTPPPPYVQVDPNGPNMDTEVTNIIAALALSNGPYSPYINI